MVSDFFFGGQSFTYNVASDYQQVLYTNTFNNIENERWDIGHFALAQGMRINFGKRGNAIGKYIDFGAFGQVHSMSDYNYIGTSRDGQEDARFTIVRGQKIQSADLVKAGSTEPFYDRGGYFAYGFYSRIGYDRFVLSGRYLVAGDFQFLTIGFELSLY